MVGEKELVCHYNQTGFCKYRDKCKNKHVNDTCADGNCSTKQCLKRHPKDCRKYKSNTGCSFNRECAYKHDTENDSTNQDEINKAVANVTIKHENEIKVLKAKMDKLKKTIETMDVNIKSLLKKMEYNADGPNNMKIAEKSPEIITVNKEVNNEELWLCCPDCEYKCETENTMMKHMNTKHNESQLCDLRSK